MNEKKVYLVVTPFFPSQDSWRGAYCYDFVQALKRNSDFDVRVLMPGSGDDYEYQGVLIYRFPVKMLPSAVLPFLFSAWNQKSFLKKIVQINIKFSDVAVCHGHTAFCGVYPLALKKVNKKCLTLLHHHDLASFGLNLGRLRHLYLHKLINFFALRKMHEQIDCHVFISEKSRNSFLSVPDASWSCYSEYQRQMSGLQMFRSTKIKSSLILHNGVDYRVFQPCKQETHGFCIGCMGNFNEIKSQITLLQAVNLLKKEFPHIHVRFVGYGELYDFCLSYVQQNNLNDIVSFEKERDHKNTPDFFYNIDLFVLPSYFEGFGCVFAEAYACGVAFITCEGQGADDLILPEERKLWLCPPRNPEILAERIRSYFINRPVQHISTSINIDLLVSIFIKQITSEIP